MRTALFAAWLLLAWVCFVSYSAYRHITIIR